ncbi:hypothetical protein JL722_7972 [Aureococcus anophagefferens]|nr:hypothetical protein JL722_7972 [Aureococcus anophagefferens]
MASSDTPPTACRWRILATVIVVESVGGLMYAFGIYSARLKSKFSLSQEQLDAISISSSLGSNVGVHWGLLTDAAGPSAALCAALGTAMCGSDVASMTTIAKAFPQNRGRATGLVKAMVGLSAALAAPPKAPVRSATALEAYGSADFWLLWFVCFAVCGSGTVVMNNLTQIAKAAGIATKGATVLVALLSISNCLCRVAAGYASDRTAARGVPRSALLAAVSVAMAARTSWGSGLKGSVYVLSVLSGGAYGAVATVHPLVAADRFGVAHLGAIYASITTANGLGSYLGSNVLAARLYDAANAPGHQVCESSARGTSCDCVGARCFADTFLVCAALNGAAALCCVVLARREARRRTAGREEAGARVEAAAPRAPYYPPVAPPSADAVDFERLASDDESDAEGGPGDGGHGRRVGGVRLMLG